MKQILIKFLSNTLRYMEHGGSVVVKAVTDTAGSREDLHSVKIFLVDTGIGPASTTRGRGQKQFALSDERRFDGTNIGLAVAKTLAESMHGKIGVDTTTTGTGASFWTSIPFASAQGTAPGVLDARFNNRKIMVVDGPTGAARSINDYCDAWGMPCDWVMTGDQAVSTLLKHVASGIPYDLIIFENITFGATGAELAKQIRHIKELDQTDIIVFTPHVQDTLASELALLSRCLVIHGPLKQSLLLSK